MKILMIIFIALSSVLSLSSLTFVGVDIYEEKKEKKADAHKKAPADVAETANARQNEPRCDEPEQTELPEPVERIDAESADAIISDTVAMAGVCYESGASVGFRDFVNIGDIDKSFNAGDIVTIDELKKAGLVQKRASRLKILADGYLTKPLTVKADSFSIQAIKMIRLTGGTVVVLRGKEH